MVCVWCGVEWAGMGVCDGVVWYDMVLRCGAVRCGAGVRVGLRLGLGCCVVWCGVMWCGALRGLRWGRGWGWGSAWRGVA